MFNKIMTMVEHGGQALRNAINTFAMGYGTTCLEEVVDFHIIAWVAVAVEEEPSVSVDAAFFEEHWPQLINQWPGRGSQVLSKIRRYFSEHYPEAEPLRQLEGLEGLKVALAFAQKVREELKLPPLDMVVPDEKVFETFRGLLDKENSWEDSINESDVDADYLVAQARRRLKETGLEPVDDFENALRAVWDAGLAILARHRLTTEDRSALPIALAAFGYPEDLVALANAIPVESVHPTRESAFAMRAIALAFVKRTVGLEEVKDD